MKAKNNQLKVLKWLSVVSWRMPQPRTAVFFNQPYRTIALLGVHAELITKHI